MLEIWYYTRNSVENSTLTMHVQLDQNFFERLLFPVCFPWLHVLCCLVMPRSVFLSSCQKCPLNVWFFAKNISRQTYYPSHDTLLYSWNSKTTVHNHVNIGGPFMWSDLFSEKSVLCGQKLNLWLWVTSLTAQQTLHSFVFFFSFFVIFSPFKSYSN